MTSTFIREHKGDKRVVSKQIILSGFTEIIFEDIIMKKTHEISDLIKIQKLMSYFKTLVPLCGRHSGVFFFQFLYGYKAESLQ